MRDLHRHLQQIHRQAISDNAYVDYSVEAKQTVGPKSIPKMASWLLRRDGAC